MTTQRETVRSQRNRSSRNPQTGRGAREERSRHSTPSTTPRCHGRGSLCRFRRPCMNEGRGFFRVAVQRNRRTDPAPVSVKHSPPCLSSRDRRTTPKLRVWFLGRRRTPCWLPCANGSPHPGSRSSGDCSASVFAARSMGANSHRASLLPTFTHDMLPSDSRESVANQ